MLRLPPFKYVVPKTLAEAAKILAGEGPNAAPVAGGTDLYPNMKRRQQTPKTVIGLGGVKELKGLQGTPKQGLRLGTGLTLTQVCEDSGMRSAYKALADAAESVSTPLLRNMGTIGGNLCLDTRCTYYDQTYEWRKSIDFCMKKDGHICWVAPKSPRCWAVSSSDTAPVMVALGATFTLASDKGTREVKAADFFHDDGMRFLNKKPEELLTSIQLPAVNGWKATYLKLRRREAFDFPVLGVAACLHFGKGGVVEDAKIVLGAISSAPVIAEVAQNLLKGQKLTPELIQAAADAAYKPAGPLDNTDFTMLWRKQMVRVYVARALKELSPS